jgi:hypothetical protein
MFLRASTDDAINSMNIPKGTIKKSMVEAFLAMVVIMAVVFPSVSQSSIGQYVATPGTILISPKLGGVRTDEVFFGDWRGNGQATWAIKRGNDYYFQLSTAHNIWMKITYGSASDRFLVGDWNHDGKDTIAVYNVKGEYSFINSLHGGKADFTMNNGAAYAKRLEETRY